MRKGKSQIGDGLLGGKVRGRSGASLPVFLTGNFPAKAPEATPKAQYQRVTPGSRTDKNAFKMHHRSPD